MQLRIYIYPWNMGLRFLLVSSTLISCGGDPLGTGGNRPDSGSAGAVAPPLLWQATAYVKSPAPGNDQLFSIPAIDGNTMAVGEYQGNGGKGAVHIYVRSGGNWSWQQTLTASNGDAGDNFGTSVSISGDTVVVGAWRESSNQTTVTNGSAASANNDKPQSGAAYVFRRSGTTWAQEAYLKASNADVYDYFGQSVSISGDAVVVGAIGESSNQTTVTHGGAASANNDSYQSGAAYIFRRSGATWSQEAYLKASNAEVDDWFGGSVSISGDTVVVGAHQESSNQTTVTNGGATSANNDSGYSGAAHVFRRSGTTWSQEAYLKASNADASDSFGISVSISGDTVVVGAYIESSNQTTVTNGGAASANNDSGYSGAAYVFRRSSDTVVVGASAERSNQNTVTNGGAASADNSLTNAGAVYVFQYK